MSTVDTFDDIIVGAGSAGIPLAARLSADPSRRVVLLEAGPDYRTAAETPRDLLAGNEMSLIHHDWGFTSGPIPIRRWRPEELTPVQESFLNGTLAAGYSYTDDHNHPDSTGIGPAPSTRRDSRTRVSTATGYLTAEVRARSDHHAGHQPGSRAAADLLRVR